MEPTPDPESVGLLVKLIGAASAVILPSWAGWNWLDKRFAKKHLVSEALQVLTNEQALQRTHIAKIFDQMRDAEHIAESRHRELLMHMMQRNDR